MVLLCFSLFPSYTLTLKKMLLLWESTLLFRPGLQSSPLLKTDHPCDNSKVWYYTCFLSLLLKGWFTFVKCHTREQVKTGFTWNTVIILSPAPTLKVNYPTLMTFYYFWPEWYKDKDLIGNSWLHTQHRTCTLYTDSPISPIHLLQF